MFIVWKCLCQFYIRFILYTIYCAKTTELVQKCELGEYKIISAANSFFSDYIIFVDEQETMWSHFIKQSYKPIIKKVKSNH